MPTPSKFSWPPSFPIAPLEGHSPRPLEDLYDEVFTCIAYAVPILARSKASPQVLFDYLPSSRGDFVAAAMPDEIGLYFRSPAGMCNMAAEAATHWAELTLLALRPQLDEVLAEFGYALVDPPALDEVLARGPKYPLIELGTMPYCVVRRKRPDAAPEIFTDEIADPLRYEALTPAQRKRVAALADGAPCECSLCKRLRKNPAPRIDLRAMRARDAASTEASNLTAALRARDTVRSLYLSEKQLYELPPEIGRLTRLESLYVGHNGLHELPPEIGALESLRLLHVNENQLRTLPEAMKALARLETLDLGGNPWEALPAWLPELPALKTLRLSFYPACPAFEPFPGAMLRAMSRLEALDIIGAKEWARELEAFPWDALPALRSLNLQNCALREVPPALVRCASLEQLSLSGSAIRELPPEITRLARLRALTLQSNALTALPDAIGTLHALESLYVGWNPIAALPASVTALRALKALELGECKLTRLPEDFGELANLELLYLDACPLEALPGSFGKLSRLRSLYVRRTPKIRALLAPHRASLSRALEVYE